MKYRLVSAVIIIVLSLLIASPVNASEEEILYSDFKSLTPQVNGLVGAARQVIPIEAPPGRAGLEPQIALTYNSYQKNGWLGVGWNIRMGAIQRSTKHGLEYAACDFIAAGKELIATDIDGSCNGEYKAKIEGGFVRYDFSHSNGWTAISKDGKKFLYGQNTLSRHDNPDHSDEVLKWCLDRIEDNNGNFMTVNYKKPEYQQNGQIYLDRINYTGSNEGLDPVNYIKFIKDAVNRTDVAPRYDSNFKVSTTERLKTIEVYSKGQLVSRYELDYNYSNTTYRSLLKTISFSGADGGSFGSIDIDHQDGGDGSFTQTLYTNNLSASGLGDWTMYPADFNGDGKADLIFKYPTSNQLQTFRSNGDGTFTQSWHTNSLSASGLGGWIMYPADFNGDGKADLIFKYPTTNQLQTFKSNGDGTFTQSWHTNSLSPQGLSGWKMYTTDFDGDGKADLIFKYPTTNQLQTFKSNGDGTFAQTWYTGSLSAHGLGDWTTYTADFNGDGKNDLIAKYPQSNQLQTFASIGDGTFRQEWYTSNLSAQGLGGWAMYPADFNGDGKSDLIFKFPSTNQLQTFVSNGDGSFTQTGYTDSLSPQGLGGWSMYPADFSGDGKSDLIFKFPSTNQLQTFQQNGLIADLISDIDNGFGNDARTNITYTSSSNFNNLLLPFIVYPVSGLKVDDGNGVTSTTTYHYQGGLFDFIDRDFRGFKTATKTNPNSTTQKTVFYQGRFDGGDPEDAGDNYFLKGRVNYVENRESANGNLISRTEMTYGQRDEGNNSEFVYLDKKISKAYENGQIVSNTLEDPISYDAAGNLTLMKICEADSAGSCDAGGTTEKVTKTFDYENFGSDTDPLWRKTMEIVEGEPKPDGSGLVRRTIYRYTNDGRANLWQKEFWHDLGANPIITYAYDAYGNLEKEWDALRNPTTDSPNAVYEYDPETHTFPVKVTNALGHFIETDWDQRFGKELWTIDANGIRTDFQYDEFGRSTQTDVTDPSGNLVGRTITEYHLDGQPRYVKTRVLESQSPESYIDAYQYVDGLGRTIQTISMGIRQGTPTPVVTRTYYDAMGRAHESWGPYFGAAVTYPSNPIDSDVPKSWTVFDLRSRPIDIHSLDSQHGSVTVHYDYDGLSTTVTDPDGSRKKTTKDYLGRMVEVVEYTETDELRTRYEYNAAGDLRHVKNALWSPNDPDKNITTMTYDTIGRKISMTDPDMGSWQYGYDANGNLSWQEDAKLQRIEFEYDALNRVTLKHYVNPDIDDHDVIYTYDDAGITTQYPIGRLSRVSNTVTITTYNRYDALGNAQSVTQSINGDSAARTSESYFDLVGRPASTVYPDGYQVNYNYFDGTGLLESVMGLNDLIGYVSYSDYPATGKVKKAVFDNGVETTYSYDPLSTRLTGIQTRHATHGEFMNRSYTYTRAGDIETINDAVSGNTRFYEYDKLHRLISEYSSADDYNYLVPSVLDYSYDATKPLHGVSHIDNLGDVQEYIYEDNGNMTSAPDLSDPSNPASRTISYNMDNMPTTIYHSAFGTTEIVYSGGGSRAKKSGPNGTTYYYGAHFENQGGELVKYIFAGGQRVAMVKGGQTRYFHKDHLGSSSVITNVDGAKVQEADYLPFGGQRGSGTITVSNFGFTDQEKDPEFGLYNYNARLYDPAIAVFITADTIVPDPGGSQGFNRYAYCINNPLIYTDPSGHSWLSDIWDGLRDSFDPIRIYENGGVTGLWMAMSDPVMNTITYTHEGGFGTSYDGSAKGFIFGGVIQTKGPNAGISGYIGYGYSTNGVIVGGRFWHNNHGDYSAGIYAEYKGVSASYIYSSNTGKWGASAAYSSKGVSVTYNFDDGSWQGSIDRQAIVKDAAMEYGYALRNRLSNGYGPAGGPGIFKLVDFLGSVSMSYKASDNHDLRYGIWLRSKSTSDRQFLLDNFAGSFRNIGRGRVLQGAFGLAVSPIYYGAVAFGGRNAYDAAQAEKARARGL